MHTHTQTQQHGLVHLMISAGMLIPHLKEHADDGHHRKPGRGPSQAIRPMDPGYQKTLSTNLAHNQKSSYLLHTVVDPSLHPPPGAIGTDFNKTVSVEGALAPSNF